MDQSTLPLKQIRARLPGLLDALEPGLFERRRIVRLCLLAALAGEHSLLIGPPGHAKSERPLRLHTVGEFPLPPSRVEAMYAPEMFGEAPNARIKVEAVK